jgi:hypothetical protein
LVIAVLSLVAARVFTGADLGVVRRRARAPDVVPEVA